MKNKIIMLLLFGIFSSTGHSQEINADGTNILERFIPPKGFTRVLYDESSFQDYIRKLPLKSMGSPVLLYNGDVKRNSVHISVFDIPLQKKDLIQCADAVIKIRAEYLYKQKRYKDITFTITNKMKIPFLKFAKGYRISVKGNTTKWVNGFSKGTGRAVFDEYLTFIYMYAGTYSLSRELKKCSVSDIKAGDVFIYGGSPGHVVMVVDLAINSNTKEKVMLLAQSYMPSQDFHILKSFSGISPWYYVSDEELVTPEWTFGKGSLMQF